MSCPCMANSGPSAPATLPVPIRAMVSAEISQVAVKATEKTVMVYISNNFHISTVVKILGNLQPWILLEYQGAGYSRS